MRVTGGDATGGGAVFSSDGPLYNRVLRKKLIRIGSGPVFVASEFLGLLMIELVLHRLSGDAGFEFGT